MELKPIATTYELKPDDIKEMIAEKLKKDIDKITVDFIIEEVGGDPMDRYPGYPGTDTVTKILVKVKDI